MIQGLSIASHHDWIITFTKQYMQPVSTFVQWKYQENGTVLFVLYACLSLTHLTVQRTGFGLLGSPTKISQPINDKLQ